MLKTRFLGAITVAVIAQSEFAPLHEAAWAQTVPQLAQPVLIEGLHGLGNALGSKGDAAGGHFTTPTITGGSIDGTTTIAGTAASSIATGAAAGSAAIPSATMGASGGPAAYNDSRIVNAIPASALNTTVAPLSGGFVPVVNLPTATSSVAGVSTTAAVTAAAGVAGTALQPTGNASATRVLATGIANRGPVGNTSQTQAAKNGERLSAADFNAFPTATSDPFGVTRSAFTAAGGGVLYLPSAGTAGWAVDSYGTPTGMSYEADGPNVSADRLLGQGASTIVWGKAWMSRLPSSNTQQVTANYMAVTAPGSGSGTQDQTVLSIKATKDNFKNPATAVTGGLGGLNISVFNGSATGVVSDTYALNEYIQAGYSSGFAVLEETKIQEFCADNTNFCYSSDYQLGNESSAYGNHIGFNMEANLGVHASAIQTTGGTSGGNSSVGGAQGRWSAILTNTLNSIRNISIMDTGAIQTAPDGTTATQINLTNVAGVDTFTNGSGTVLATISQTGVVGAVTFNQTGFVAPTTATTACTTGQFGDAAGYHYACIATNSWQRSAAAAW